MGGHRVVWLCGGGAADPEEVVSKYLGGRGRCEGSIIDSKHLVTEQPWITDELS